VGAVQETGKTEFHRVAVRAALPARLETATEPAFAR
jgi:hypothetical protein